MLVHTETMGMQDKKLLLSAPGKYIHFNEQ